MTVPTPVRDARADRAWLDAQYNNRAKVPAFQSHLDRWLAEGERARATLAHRDVRYGPSAREVATVFPADAAGGPSPVLLFIHGGYWMSLDRRFTDFVALGLVPHGVAVVNADYDLMPGVRMDEVVHQCRAALAWTLANAESFGGDPARVWVAGHSAGGHLAMACAAADAATVPGWPAGVRPAGGVSISGLHDLEPIRCSYLNDTLRMDADEARRNAPVGMAAPRDGDWSLWVGGLEGPEYLRQAVDLAATWGSATDAPGARRVRVEVVDGADHFSIVAPFVEPGSAASARLARTIRTGV